MRFNDRRTPASLSRRVRPGARPIELVLCAVLVLVASVAQAVAQDAYPNHPVKIIAPQGPGGGVDLVARLIADKLRVALGQSCLLYTSDAADE